MRLMVQQMTLRYPLCRTVPVAEVTVGLVVPNPNPARENNNQSVIYYVYKVHNFSY